MAMKLHGLWYSPFIKLVAFTLHEKNVEFELIEADLAVMKSDEYLATKNPFGLIPAFEDGDLVLLESRAIARYVIAKYEGQGTPLMGSSLKEQALVNVWIEVESQIFFPTLKPVCQQLFSKNVPDAAVMETNVEKLNKVLDVYEAQLSKHKYLAGNFFSLADLLHIPTLHLFLSLANDTLRSVVTSRPRFHAWYQEVSARPAWKKIVEIPEASDWSFVKKV